MINSYAKNTAFHVEWCDLSALPRQAGTCEPLIMVLLRRSQKGFTMDDEHALTALGRMKSHPWALLRLIFSSTAFTIWY